MSNISLSYSSIDTFQSCQRKYYYSRVLRVQPKKRPTYFVVGEAIHAFLEQHYKGMPNPSGAIDEVFKKVSTSLMDADQVHYLACDLAMSKGIAGAYPKFYEQDFHTYTKFVPEQKFELNFGPFNYTGFLDMLMQDAAGDWWILETKTVSAQTMSDDYLQRVKIDWQVTGYMYAARKILGVLPRGVVYNVIKKPGIRLKKGETKSTFQTRVRDEYSKFAHEKGYFTRAEVLIGMGQLKMWKSEVMQVGADIVSRHESKKQQWPMSTGACIGKYGSCQYLPACIDGKFNQMIYDVPPATQAAR